MFDLSELVTALTEDNFRAALDAGKEPTLANQDEVGRIQVGYHSVESQGGLGDGVSSDSCQKLTEDLSFVFYTQFTCSLTDFPTFWKQVYLSVNAWIPSLITSDRDYTATFLDKGGKKGIANGRIWWIDYWQIDFPRVESRID